MVGLRREVEVEGAVALVMKRKGWGVHGRLLLKLARGVFIGVWCWPIGVRGGVFLPSGNVCEGTRKYGIAFSVSGV